MPKDSLTTDKVAFIHDLKFRDLPNQVRLRAELCLLDLIGVGYGGATTPMSRIIRNHAARFFGGGDGKVRMLFDGRAVSGPGAALAGGMTIDALDGHDGYNPAKGHVGCGLFPEIGRAHV